MTDTFMKITIKEISFPISNQKQASFILNWNFLTSEVIKSTLWSSNKNWAIQRLQKRAHGKVVLIVAVSKYRKA